MDKYTDAFKNTLNKLKNKYTNAVNEYKDKDMFVLFIKDINECSYSENALKLLREKNKSYRAYVVKSSIKNKDKKEDMLNCLKSSNSFPKDKINYNTLPVIFYKQKFIGGYDDLVEYFKK